MAAATIADPVYAEWLRAGTHGRKAIGHRQSAVKYARWARDMVASHNYGMARMFRAHEAEQNALAEQETQLAVEAGEPIVQ